MGRLGQAGLLVFGLLFLSCGATVEPVNRTESDLLAEISRIKAIDNHAHPYKVVADGEKPDDEFDALPLEGLEPFTLPLRLRPENTEYASAWRQLFAYPHADLTAAHLKEGVALKQRVAREHGDGYPEWVLDQLGIGTMLANRVALGRGLKAPRFRWVSFADSLMVPLNNEAAKRANKDYAVFYPGEERLLKRYLNEAGVAALPRTLDDYLATVVAPTLARHKRDGALAIKFEAAYLRALDFDDASQDDAQRVYAQYAGGGEPPAPSYKILQDFLFRAISREAGRAGLAVHIHVADGAGGNYNQRGADPLLLTSAFNDPTLRSTKFVILHAGYPFTRQVASLMGKSNVYADFSSVGFTTYPREMASIVRQWLEWYPEKVLFGTDATPLSAELNWEETGWLSATTSRKALAMALAGMVDDGEISRARAGEMATMVLRGNAMKLYDLH